MENNKKVSTTNTKKIVGEIILIPLCILYLYYSLLYNHPKVSNVLLYLVLLFTSIEFIVKYIKEVYIYESKYNFLKIVFIIFNFLLILIGILSIFLKYQVIKIILISFLIIMLCYLLYFAIANIIKISKNEGKLFNNAIGSFFPLISFVIVLMGLIIYLK